VVADLHRLEADLLVVEPGQHDHGNERALSAAETRVTRSRVKGRRLASSARCTRTASFSSSSTTRTLGTVVVTLSPYHADREAAEREE